MDVEDERAKGHLSVLVFLGVQRSRMTGDIP